MNITQKLIKHHLILILQLVFNFLDAKPEKSTFSSTEVGVLFPSSMPESKLDVLVEALLGSAAVSSKGSECFEGGFCLGKGTGTTMLEPGRFSVGVSGAVPFLGKGRGVDEEGVGVAGRSPSKLV